GGPPGSGPGQRGGGRADGDPRGAGRAGGRGQDHRQAGAHRPRHPHRGPGRGRPHGQAGRGGDPGRGRAGDGRPVTLAAILAPWGIRGEVKVDLLSDDPERLRPGLEVWVAPPGGGPARPDTVEWARPHGRFWRVKLAGCPDRTAAEALRGGRLQVPEDRVPPLPEGRY